jgi:signal peptidase I
VRTRAATTTIAIALALAGCASAGVGGDSEQDAVRDTVDDYVKALAVRDGERLCSLLTGKSLADARAGGACALDGQGATDPDQDVDIGAVQVAGDRASAEMAQDRTVVVVGLVRHGQGWLIERVEARRLEFRVPSESMRPTLDAGERVVVDATAYAEKPVRRGDVVLFQGPAIQGCPDPRAGLGFAQMCDEPVARFAQVRLVKRVVGVAGDRLAVRDGHLIVNGKAEDESGLIPCDEVTLCTFPKTIVVPPESVYVLGDNRGASEDSRVFGPVPVTAVQGRIDV